jgi:hypothetical protein
MTRAWTRVDGLMFAPRSHDHLLRTKSPVMELSRLQEYPARGSFHPCPRRPDSGRA